MPGLQQDYLLTQIDLLRRFVARLANKREESGLEEALQLAFNLQERLFQIPASEFLRMDVAHQIESLMAGETKVNGAGKCLTYAQLLKETAMLYQIRGRDDLAAGARQLALHVALSVAIAEPASAGKFSTLINELDAAVDRENLHPPVLELLNAYQRA